MVQSTAFEHLQKGFLCDHVCLDVLRKGDLFYQCCRCYYDNSSLNHHLEHNFEFWLYFVMFHTIPEQIFIFIAYHFSRPFETMKKT